MFLPSDGELCPGRLQHRFQRTGAAACATLLGNPQLAHKPHRPPCLALGGVSRTTALSLAQFAKYLRKLVVLLPRSPKRIYVFPWRHRTVWYLDAGVSSETCVHPWSSLLMQAPRTMNFSLFAYKGLALPSPSTNPAKNKTIVHIRPRPTLHQPHSYTPTEASAGKPAKAVKSKACRPGRCKL